MDMTASNVLAVKSHGKGRLRLQGQDGRNGGALFDFLAKMTIKVEVFRIKFLMISVRYVLAHESLAGFGAILFLNQA
jgi:hypothetical protein